MIRVHSIVESSLVNGPGDRAVVWLQGCQGMNCPGCWNPQTHSFSGGTEWHPLDLADKLSDLRVDGVTFSGGEPCQQMNDVVKIARYLKEFRPDFSIGMFTGYTEKELDSGNYFEYKIILWQSTKQYHWSELKNYLDWAIMGRYNPLKPSNDSMLSSSNQVLRLFTYRYKPEDFKTQMEVIISDTDYQITGFPLKG